MFLCGCPVAIEARDILPQLPSSLAGDICRFFLLHVLNMADAMAFNNVPPPPAAPVDPNSAFADALKRAKEVRN